MCSRSLHAHWPSVPYLCELVTRKLCIWGDCCASYSCIQTLVYLLNKLPFTCSTRPHVHLLICDCTRAQCRPQQLPLIHSLSMRGPRCKHRTTYLRSRSQTHKLPLANANTKDLMSSHRPRPQGLMAQSNVCVFVCTSKLSSFALKGRPRGCRGSDRVRPVGTVPASNGSDGAVPSYLCSIRMVGERVCVPECQWGEGRCRGRTSGVRADADNPGEVGADPEGTREVKGSGNAGEWGTGLESIGRGPSRAGKPTRTCWSPVSSSQI